MSALDMFRTQKSLLWKEINLLARGKETLKKGSCNNI